MTNSQFRRANELAGQTATPQGQEHHLDCITRITRCGNDCNCSQILAQKIAGTPPSWALPLLTGMKEIQRELVLIKALLSLKGGQ